MPAALAGRNSFARRKPGRSDGQRIKGSQAGGEAGSCRLRQAEGLGRAGRWVLETGLSSSLMLGRDQLPELAAAALQVQGRASEGEVPEKRLDGVSRRFRRSRALTR